MDYVPILAEQAKQRGLSFTPLSHILRMSQSDKVACCGGSVVRVVTESSSDSTVAIQDGPHSMCYCALHGDVTSRYPDVLTPGALLLFTNVTALILSSAVAPLLIVCTENLAGLALPQDTGYPPRGSSTVRASDVTVGESVAKAHAHRVPTESSAESPVRAPDDTPPIAPPSAVAPVRVDRKTTLAQALEGTSAASSEDEDGLELVDDL